nr:MAG TPA: hypothetical protein [Inoviridae sp.]
MRFLKAVLILFQVKNNFIIWKRLFYNLFKFKKSIRQLLLVLLLCLYLLFLFCLYFTQKLYLIKMFKIFLI